MFREIITLMALIGISFLLVCVAIMCTIPREELGRSRNKREYDKAIRDLSRE